MDFLRNHVLEFHGDGRMDLGAAQHDFQIDARRYAKETDSIVVDGNVYSPSKNSPVFRVDSQRIILWVFVKSLMQAHRVSCYIPEHVVGARHLGYVSTSYVPYDLSGPNKEQP